MGKKKPEEMAKERGKFLEGSVQNNVEADIATYVFDLMEKFAGYGFNKSHSAAYALVAYQTAWLKAHYPSAFMAAVLSSDMDNTDKVVILIDECRQMKQTILPPAINISMYKFTVNEASDIIYGLGAIKGVGQAAIEDMILEREERGVFLGLYDLCQRVDLRKFNRRVLEALIRAGAFDEFDENRASHLAELPTALRVAEQHGKMAKTGQNDMFALPGLNIDELDDGVSGAYAQAVMPWTDHERLAAEKLTLGLFLTGHPIDSYEAELKHYTHGKIAALKVGRGSVEARIAGLIVEVRTRQNKKGGTMGFVTLDDNSGRLECALFGEVYEKYRGLLGKDCVLIAEGGLAIDNFSGNLRLTVEKLYDIDQAREQFARGLQLTWNKDSTVAQVAELLTPFKKGSCPVTIAYSSKQARTMLQLGDEWRIYPTDELIARLKALLGADSVEIRYR